MNKLILKNYNLHWTLMGGQSFSWDYDLKENTYYGFTQDKAIVIKVLNCQLGVANFQEILWQTYPFKDDFEFLKSYLRLDEDYEFILSRIKKDEHIIKAIETYPGLRILKQDFEQTLMSFILSSTRNIPAIRKSIRDLSFRYGEKVQIGQKEIYLFPRTEVFASKKIEELLESKIGFRAKYIQAAAKKLLEENNTLIITSKNEQKIREYLTSFQGVGEKIADCTMVFALEFNNFTPLDVWGKRVFTDLYNLDSNMKYEEMRKWGDDYFEGYAAWAGQFLFEYIRK